MIRTASALLAVVLLTACGNADADALARYETELAAGRAATTVTDDIFLGLELGMTDQQFFDRCTQLNKERLITMGAGGNRVNYKMKDALSRPATLTFYPAFSEDRPRIIDAMDIEVVFDDWAPWNKDAHTPQLMADLLTWTRRKFGEDAYVVPHPKFKKVIVHLQDNRRVMFWAKDNATVRGRVTDLRKLPEEPLALVDPNASGPTPDAERAQR